MSEIVIQARLDIVPIINPLGSIVSVEVSVPVPESDLNCDGLILPIEPLLEQLVANKSKNGNISSKKTFSLFLNKWGYD